MHFLRSSGVSVSIAALASSSASLPLAVRAEGLRFQGTITDAAPFWCFSFVEVSAGAVVSTMTLDERTTRVEGNTCAWPNDALTVQWSVAAGSTYNLDFLITTSGSTTSFASVLVTTSADEVDPATRIGDLLQVHKSVPELIVDGFFRMS
ncbi:MAG: hypothetical protein NZ750_07165 [Anaerolineae bacterium]|nr:hypothetical protein [Anaerolineae bacterium]MDW8170891.1 hypothetical protein [Anaerolineae bacterium]